MTAALSRREEWFDVVDARDQVVGRELRAVVHAQKLLHRAVHLFLRNAAGELFLQQRSAFKDQDPNVWDSSVSGHVDSGETYDTAAQRELGEELGVDAKALASPLVVLDKIEACAETGWEFVTVYAGRHEGPFTWPVEEISDGRFWTRVSLELALRETPQQFSSALKKILAVLGSRIWEEASAV